jgi:hypothetical protein
MIDFDALLEQDAFLNSWCVRCGYNGILYATPRWFTACPKCLAERMRAVRETGVELPGWFLYVERIAVQYTQKQARESLASPTVSFDDLCSCGGCGRLILVNGARYHFEPDTRSSPPYCPACYAERSG